MDLSGGVVYIDRMILRASFRRVLPVVCLSLAACGKVDPLPEDLDGLFHYLWLHAEDGEPAEMAAAVAKVEALVGGAELEEALHGTLTDLSAEEVAVVEMDVDPSLSAGVSLVNPIVCDLDLMERNLYHLKQEELYPDYEIYNREYTSDIEAYKARTADTITWTTTYTAQNALSGRYESVLNGSMRRIDASDAEVLEAGEALAEDGEEAPSPVGVILLARAWITQPAVFEREDTVFDQDFQMEIFYQSGDRLLHVYPLWRHLEINDVLNMDSEGFQATLLNELERYDEDTEKLCADGIPEAE